MSEAPPLTIVTASIAPERTRDFWGTWLPLCSLESTRIVHVVNSPEEQEPGEMLFGGHFRRRIEYVRSPQVLGPVGAFSLGIETAAEQGASLLALLHDDLALLDYGWDKRVVEHFAAHPACALAGFSGAEGLGAPDIYQGEKDLSKLARQGFFSNMVDAENHGRREARPRVSACADGFSQIGRTPFLLAAFNHFKVRGVRHHFYDSWLGMLCWKWGRECWFLPERCAHAGGRTAVLAAEYHAWAEDLGGDAGLWKAAHEAGWEDGKGFLPFRVGEAV